LDWPFNWVLSVKPEGSIRSYPLSHRVMDYTPSHFSYYSNSEVLISPVLRGQFARAGDSPFDFAALFVQRTPTIHSSCRPFLLLSSCHVCINPRRSTRRGPATWRNVLFTNRISIQSCGKRTRARNVGKKCLGISLAHPKLFMLVLLA